MTKKLDDIVEDLGNSIAATFAAAWTEFLYKNECRDKAILEERKIVVQCFPISSDESFLDFERKLTEPKFRMATVSIYIRN